MFGEREGNSKVLWRNERIRRAGGGGGREGERLRETSERESERVRGGRVARAHSSTTKKI